MEMLKIMKKNFLSTMCKYTVWQLFDQIENFSHFSGFITVFCNKVQFSILDDTKRIKYQQQHLLKSQNVVFFLFCWPLRLCAWTCQRLGCSSSEWLQRNKNAGLAQIVGCSLPTLKPLPLSLFKLSYWFSHYLILSEPPNSPQCGAHSDTLHG